MTIKELMKYKTTRDMDFKPKPKDVIELNVEDNYVIFRQHKKTKFAIRKGSGRINVSGNCFGFGFKLK